MNNNLLKILLFLDSMYSNSSLKARTALGSLTPCLSIIRSRCAMYDLRKPLKFKVLFIACEEQELVKEELKSFNLRVVIFTSMVNLHGSKNTKKMTIWNYCRVKCLTRISQLSSNWNSDKQQRDLLC